ncbi:MAG: ABC transporter permease [Oscillospiraceae bacterium]|jgi:spermidine/putrescine transport system permease protein|nr:ABC transporter permease [Oscillospiraceae bacterium]
MKTKMSLPSKLYTAMILLFLYAPIGVLIAFSFNASNSTAVFEGFSFKWYGELFRDSMTLNALRNTLIIAVGSSVFATVLGTAAAVGINAYKSKPIKNSVMSVTNIPMMNPEIVTGISMMFLFVFIGRMLSVSNVLGFWTLLIAHITFNLPYVILNVLPKLRQTDVHLSEAAMDLGCTPAKAFFKVVLPAIMPGILSGLIMAFTLSLDDFIISHFVSGPASQTLPLRIYAMTKKRVTPDMYALSTLIFVTILLLLLLTNLSQTRADKKANKIVKIAK